MVIQPKTLISRGKYSSCIELLKQPHCVGKVESIFEHGLNIAFDDELVFIGIESNMGSPFGIHVESFLYEQLLTYTRIGEDVTWDLKTMQISFVNSNIHIIISMMESFDCRLLPHPLDAEKLSSLATTINEIVGHSERISHLGVDWGNSQLKHSIYGLSYASLRKFSELEKMMKEDQPLDVELVRYFIGQGIGLTPSGDDFLVGISAVEHMMQEHGGKVSNALRQLEKDLPQLTTNVSKNYYKYASAGYFSTAILELIHTFRDGNYTEIYQACNQLLRVGGSSGADTCSGITFALKVYGK